MLEKRVGSLPEGTMFMVAGLNARVLRSNECRTLVQIDSNRHVKIKTLSGDEADFNAAGGKVSISSGSMVVPVWDDLGADFDEYPVHKTREMPTGSKRSGKPAEPALIKPVNATKKVGQILKELIDTPHQDPDVLAEKFSVSRACLMSHLAGLHKTYGIGYSIAQGMVSVALPAGCVDPFKKGKK